MKARKPVSEKAGTPGRLARWLCGLLVIMGAVTILLLLKPPAPAPRVSSPGNRPVEIPRAQLELRSAGLCLIGATNTFNGWMVEHYPDGALRSRSAVTNGLLHGLSQGWHTNGQLQVVEHFKEGVSHGLRTKWYADGTKASETTIVNGQIHGTFRRWHENGTLSEEMEMKSGQAQGTARAYFASGLVKSQVTLIDGKVVEQKVLIPARR